MYNRNWSAIGAPVLTLPIGKDPDGLPMGLQVVGGYLRDGELIDFGRHLERLLSEGA
ncbi:hypothetical protein CDEF62S_01620 [Castellaniella defragrans]